ncbi:ankyrin repeat-containing domain, PGG domain protein [Artemisia annua]|uniref:Ankyrin repeat-containing domain, PGG domain protein n=1 Tax=Artemisia annua TaxID=35608 RepID=A0A2U1PQF0_ARTAN|nr:ankyrin repeat-containing domain, PGG domain protein [Artemisia annua]
MSHDAPDISDSVESTASGTRPNVGGYNLPDSYLLKGYRENYLKIAVPLYEASIKCDWKAVKTILDQNEENFVSCGLTQNYDTALHVAASANGPKKVVEFVRNLVEKMTEEDLELVNINQNTALYLAAVAGNIETVKIMMAKNRNLQKIPGGKGKMMPLYAAVLFGKKDVAWYLYSSSVYLGTSCWNDQNRCWLLDKCVESDMFDLALDIVESHPHLGMMSSILGILARKPEAFRRKKSHFIQRTINSVSSYFNLKVEISEEETEALKLLRTVWEAIMKLPTKDIDDKLRGPPDSVESDSGRVIHTIRLEKHLDKFQEETQIELTDDPKEVNKLRNLVSEHVLDMHDEIQALIKENKTASGKGDRILELQKLISEYIVKIRDETESLIELQPGRLAHKLQEVILKHIYDVRKNTKPKTKHSSRILFAAAEAGNTRFLVELIRLRPDLIWKVDDNNQTIFHIAVKHRHQGIYNLLYEIGAMKDMITPLKDRQGNNMLHLVGKIVKPKRLEDVSGVALQMQRELLWFLEVQDMIPLSYKDQKNEDDLTPHELFTKEHKDLVTKGEIWMKGTANQCMVVAALIATIVFAAAFTVPGGYDQNVGIPIFYSKATFLVFVVADAISLFASSASILIFLSILTSRYAERDFLESIPNKLMAGLATLFISIATMTLAFGVSFFVLYKNGFLWIPILIGVFALLPVILYLCLQYGLFFDIIRSTYASRYLFKPKKHVLYYENPKV